ncbi:rod shape-determining protein MreD [Niallia sp. Krafla_26]|uniref:rod shape-determining protein MreD n=1 Tax=Niallia sp. Krafla_26 TaxID=3064703 RepID=UPI003D186985
MKFFLPLIISLCFIGESIFVELLPEAFSTNEKIIVPHFLIVVIIFAAIYGDRKQGLIYGLIFGLLFDIVYTEIIGIYLFIIPLVTYIAAWMMKLLQTNILVVGIVTLIGIALLELGVYEMNFLIGLTRMDFTSYLQVRLLPTLLFNGIFIAIVAFPLKKFMDSYRRSLNE